MNASSLSSLFSRCAHVLFGASVLLLPWIFFPWTLDPIEITKQTLLLLFVGLATACLCARVLLRGECLVRPNALHVLAGLIGISAMVTAFFSRAPYLSLVGQGGAESMSVLTGAGFFLLFVLATLFEPEMKWVHNARFFLMISGFIAGTIGLLSLLRVPFAPLFSSGVFTPIGSPNMLVLYLSVLGLLALSSFLQEKTASTARGSRPFFTREMGEALMSALVLIEAVLLLLVVNYAWLWMVFGIGCALTLGRVWFSQERFAFRTVFMLPVLLLCASLLFAFLLPSPLASVFGQEITPSFPASLSVAEETLQGATRFIGTGQGTYAMDFARFHPRSFNETDFWNTRFDRASSFVLTLVPTVGMVGVGLLLLFAAWLGMQAMMVLWKEARTAHAVRLFEVFLPWFVLTISALLFPFSLALQWLWVLLSAWLLFFVARPATRFVIAGHRPKTMALSVIGGGMIFLVVIGVFLTTGRYIAEAAFAKAVRADRTGAPLTELVPLIDRAATLNRWNDDYVRALSQILLLRTEERLRASSPTVALSEGERQYIQSLVAASVNASVRATELSPHDPANWLARGRVYRSLIGLVDRAPELAVEAYTRTIELEPLNPGYWNERGMAHLAEADVLQPQMLAEDATVAAQATKRWEAKIMAAKADFTQATELKSNFAPAHFQLALTADREGKLGDAIAKLERVYAYNKTDVGVGFTLGTFYLKRSAAGDVSQAERVLSEVIALSPAYSDARWYLATVYERLGKSEQAKQELEAILKYDPENTIVQTRLQKFSTRTP